MPKQKTHSGTKKRVKVTGSGKLLHQPTVRVKELVNETGAVSYAAALAELFALDPDAVEAVTRPEGLS